MKIYKFGADWCGPCRLLQQRLNSFNACKVENFDVDEIDDEIIDKFNIKSIPVTVLLDDNDNELYRWIGLFNTEEILQKMKEHND